MESKFKSNINVTIPSVAQSKMHKDVTIGTLLLKTQWITYTSHYSLVQDTLGMIPAFIGSYCTVSKHMEQNYSRLRASKIMNSDGFIPQSRKLIIAENHLKVQNSLSLCCWHSHTTIVFHVPVCFLQSRSAYGKYKDLLTTREF